MATFKKVDDLISAFIDFDLLDDEQPVVTTDDEGNVVVMNHEKYAKFMEAKGVKAEETSKPIDEK